MGPLEYASSCLLGNKIQTGIDELGPSGLVDSYHRGIADVAKLVGVPRADVERVVPMNELAAIEARLRQSHPRATAAWKMHAGQFGFLDAMTALTVDGRRPDIGLCLERVAVKVKHDRELAEPLEALSVDVAAWAEVIARTRQMLEDLTWLTAALRRRVLMRAGFAAVVLVVLFSLTGAIVGIRLARDAASARVAAVGDCDADRLTQADLKWATTEQRAQVKEKIARCAAEREREAEARRVEEAQREKERKEREQREARQKACDDLASDVEKGSLSDGSKTTAGDSAAFLERVAKKSLEAADCGPADHQLPCDDNPQAKKRLESAVGDAVAKNPLLWIRKDDLSPSVRAAIIARRDTFEKNMLIGIADQAERTAKSYLTGGDKVVFERAKRLCAFATDLGVAVHQSCHTIAKL